MEPEYFFAVNDTSDMNFTFNSTWNFTSNATNERVAMRSGLLFNKNARISCLVLEIVIGCIGLGLNFMWLWTRRRRKFRVNKIILHVSIADLLVINGACMIQLIWELQTDRQWKAGDFMCRVIKYFQSFAMIASSMMLLVLAFDRHQAIVYPLRRQFSVWLVTGMGWSAAAVISIPQLIIFHTSVTNTTSGKTVTLCESGFSTFRPKWHREAYVTYVSLMNFYIPLLLLIFCYTSIFVTIATKARSQQKSQSQRIPLYQNGKGVKSRMYVQSTHSNSICRARLKTLVMTIVIITAFIVCSVPYHVVEMVYTYSNVNISPMVWGIAGAAAPANSCVNSYIFLLFSTRCCGKSKKQTPTPVLSLSSSRSTGRSPGKSGNQYSMNPQQKENGDVNGTHACNGGSEHLHMQMFKYGNGHQNGTRQNGHRFRYVGQFRGRYLSNGRTEFV